MSLKVGFVGSGFIARFQLQAMAQISGMELTAQIRRGDSEKLRALSETLGTGPAEIVESISELCQKVDVVALYAPNFSRLEAMREVAQAKKRGARVSAVICDKPLGRNLAEAREMAKLAREAGLKTAYFENQIHMAAIEAQRKQLAPVAKAMGPLLLARSSEEHSGPHSSWFWDPRRQGGGVLSDMGCHSIAVGWYLLTPLGEAPTYLKPVKVKCDVALLKWGRSPHRERLLEKHGVDYSQHPAEDFATGTVTFRNPKDGGLSKAQFTDSWMYDKQGLRICLDGLGAGYAFEFNTLQSPLSVFIGDEARSRLADSESALEKSTASAGLLTLQMNEADLYGYVGENRDALLAFAAGRDALLDFDYGVEITRLVMAAYLSAERGMEIDLTSEEINHELESYIPAIQAGRGASQLRGQA